MLKDMTIGVQVFVVSHDLSQAIAKFYCQLLSYVWLDAIEGYLSRELI